MWNKKIGSRKYSASGGGNLKLRRHRVGQRTQAKISQKTVKFLKAFPGVYHLLERGALIRVTGTYDSCYVEL